MTAPAVADPTSGIDVAIARGVAVLEGTQSASGSWRSDYSGVLFLPPLWVGTHYAIGRPLEGEEAEGWSRWLLAHQGPDGSWGLGVENPGALFSTILCYVALRMLGHAPDEAALTHARSWLVSRGGPTRSGSWGRFFLAILGLYDWSGIDPVPPESWLLPYAAPVHPGRMWCHARMVYLPMSWLYRNRATIPVDPLILELRRELYPEGYDAVDWPRHRGKVAAEDRQVPRTLAGRAVTRALVAAERLWPRRLRERACAEVLRQIRYEDEITHYRCIGPVNKLYDTLVWHFAGDADRVERHLAKIGVYRWEDESGVRMNGYDSSELWDTAFAAQALMAAGEGSRALARAHAYVDATQVTDDPSDAGRHYRCRSKGAWPFSTKEHGWPITDCTAEGLTAGLHAGLPHDRLALAVDRLLEWQNPDGSWGSYERTRAPAWLEALNPSDTFREIMIDHGHTECSGAAMRALAAYRSAYLDDPRTAGIGRALGVGQGFLRSKQLPHGGWRGGWAVCFTYGTWFGVTGLIAAGATSDDPAVRRAVRFLEGQQLADGGWGERVEACRVGRPVPADRGQPVQTAWAVLTLLAAGEADSEATQRGIAWLVDHQGADGTWTQDHVTGVFNHTCAIHYDAYPRVFPVWALAEARRRGAA